MRNFIINSLSFISDFAENRLKLAEILYHKILENVMVQDYAQIGWPVIDPALLAGLGAAGHAVGAPRGTAPLQVFVPGFIKSACIGFRGWMHPA